jgi:hypothetical protein
VAGKQHAMRALVAVERPDKVRVVGMGPAGITVFDAFSIAGTAHVVKSIRDPNDPAFERVIADTLGEISAAYDLEPRPADRKVAPPVITQDGIAIRETPQTIDIEARTALPHRVHVQILSDEKDVALDPAMWSQ